MRIFHQNVIFIVWIHLRLFNTTVILPSQNVSFRVARKFAKKIVSRFLSYLNSTQKSCFICRPFNYFQAICILWYNKGQNREQEEGHSWCGNFLSYQNFQKTSCLNCSGCHSTHSNLNPICHHLPLNNLLIKIMCSVIFALGFAWAVLRFYPTFYYFLSMFQLSLSSLLLLYPPYCLHYLQIYYRWI